MSNLFPFLISSLRYYEKPYKFYGVGSGFSGNFPISKLYGNNSKLSAYANNGA